MKKVVTVAAAGLVAAAALLVPTGGSAASNAPSSAKPYTPPALEWGACTSQRLINAGAECAMMKVPLNYKRPEGRKIQIAVSRVLHTDDEFLGMMAVNPGGPGGSGLGMATLGASIPNGVGAKYDWYGFDPRGVGSSTPSLSCNPNYRGAGYDRPNFVPTKGWTKKWWRDTTKGYARACSKAEAKALLPHVKTTDVAQDLESLRRVVGQKKLNYYGFSYGTYLGQVYATKYPNRVGRFVWDGVLNAKRAYYQANVDQNIHFDKNIAVYFKWLAKNSATFKLGKDWLKIKRDYYQLLKKLDRNPAADGRLGPAELGDALLSAGYYVYSWVEIGLAYSELVRTGDGSAMLEFYGGPGDDNGFAMYNAVQCTDAPWPDWKKTQADAWRVHDKHPFLTWGNTWYNAPCLTWAAESADQFKVRGENLDARILLISETEDAATPYSGALATRKEFPSSFLIEGVGGTTHSGSLSGIACTDLTIARYLNTGVLPKRKSGNRSDKQCDPVPPPSATGGTARSQGGLRVQDDLPSPLRKNLIEAQTAGR